MSVIQPDLIRNWAHARIQYEAGLRPIPDIAQEIGVTMVQIVARASTEHWVRDPLAKARLYTETLVAREAEIADKAILTRARAERVTAEMQAKVLVEHRQTIGRARALTARLFHELEDMTENLDLYESLSKMLAEGGDGLSQKLQRRVDQALSLDKRVDVNLKLTNALKAQLQLERQAFGIQGALEDPEQPANTSPGGLEIEKILGKFDLVLKSKETPRIDATLLGEVVDMEP